MSRYRRAHVPGATYFFTVNLLNRRSDLLVRHIDLLRGDGASHTLIKKGTYLFSWPRAAGFVTPSSLQPKGFAL